MIWALISLILRRRECEKSAAVQSGDYTYFSKERENKQINCYAMNNNAKHPLEHVQHLNQSHVMLINSIFDLHIV